MSAKLWAVPQPNPDRHLFWADADEDRHQFDKDCWCEPELICDPDDEKGKDWVWLHRTLN